MVASRLLCAVVCWGCRIMAGELRNLNKLVKKASRVAGLQLDSVEVVAERRMRAKINTIMDNPSHPLCEDLLQRARTFSHMLTRHRTRMEWFRCSFLTTASKLYNRDLPFYRQDSGTVLHLCTLV